MKTNFCERRCIYIRLELKNFRILVLKILSRQVLLEDVFVINIAYFLKFGHVVDIHSTLQLLTPKRSENSKIYVRRLNIIFFLKVALISK